MDRYIDKLHSSQQSAEGIVHCSSKDSVCRYSTINHNSNHHTVRDIDRQRYSMKPNSGRHSDRDYSNMDLHRSRSGLLCEIIEDRTYSSETHLSFHSGIGRSNRTTDPDNSKRKGMSPVGMDSINNCQLSMKRRVTFI